VERKNKKYMKNKKYVYSFTALAMFLTLAITAPVFADDTSSNQSNNGVGGGFGGGAMFNRGNKNGIMKHGVYGTVASIDGNIISVTKNLNSGTNAVTTTYTVDATNAKIIKNNIAGTISSILVGDKVMVQGTITGTNVIATTIRDGQMGKGIMPGLNSTETNKALASPINGNGQPIVAGAVATISGSILTITNKSNVSYSVDTTNAKIVQNQNIISVSDITVGDMVVVQGIVNGNTVVASSVIDQIKTAMQTHPPNNLIKDFSVVLAHSLRIYLVFS
jgi:hypothetical protein